MGLLQPYHGKFVTAKSATSDIDVDSILSGCAAVDNEVGNLTNICEDFSNSGNNITPKAFSFDGETVEPMIEQYKISTSGIADDILGITASIREAAINAYNKIQEQYNAEAKARDDAAIREANSVG
jgi:hypothetical protein